MPALSELVDAVTFPALRSYLETRTRLLRRAHEFVVEQPPPRSTAVWRPSAPFVVVAGDLEVEGNVITGAEGGASALVVLGAIRARNVLASADTEVYVGGDAVVPGLVVTDTADSTFVVCGRVTAGVVYSGHGGGWLTALGPTEIDVIDGYVAGANDDDDDENADAIRPRSPGVTARERVVPALLGADGELDAEAILEMYGETVSLLRGPG